MSEESGRGRRRRSKEERRNENMSAEMRREYRSSYTKVYGPKCMYCGEKDRKLEKYWTGQELIDLCEVCLSKAQAGELEWFFSASSTHGMVGGLPTLGKRR